MKRIFRMAAITVAAVMLLIGCSDFFESLLGSATVSFIELTATGSETSTTARLILTFDKDIDGLSVEDVTFDPGTTGAAKDMFMRTKTGVYNLYLKNITATGTVKVSVEKLGYTITGGPKTVTVYFYSGGILTSFTGLTADGSPTEADTTTLTLTFDRDIGTFSDGLSAADVILYPGTTGAVKGELTKPGWNTGEYELSVTGITASGPVTVSVEKLGYTITGGPKTAYVYKYTSNEGITQASFNELTADGSSTATSTKLTLTFSRDIVGLSAADVTFNAGTTGAVMTALMKTGIRTGEYELYLTGITASGPVTVSVVKPGYTITGGPKTANVYQYTPPVPTAVSFTGLTADGSLTATSTKLTLTFDMDIVGLSAADVTFNAGTTAAVKGALTRTGTGVYELSLTGITASGPVTVSSVTKQGYTITGGPKTANVYQYTPSEVTNNFVRKVTFTNQTATVTFTGLNNNDVYLVKVNTSGLTANAANTGGANASISGIQNIGKNSLLLEADLPRMGHPAADEFNANPLPIVEEAPRIQRFASVARAVGDTRNFWVETVYNSRVFVEKPATLMATGTYGNIWVMNENTASGTSANKITNEQAQTLAQKFDQIYPLETKLIGYEYGGGPGGDGGRDGDSKVQILVYDIVDASGTVMAAGYFWSKDFYTDTQLGGAYKSNLAEIFYIDASQVIYVPVYIHSALVHEFQHMINFNQKARRGISSASWYNEMLSMMTEDVIGPLIGIPLSNSYHTIRVRMSTALNNYHLEGITEWGTLSSRSYATKAAFGAYLMRNYGGAELLQRILANDTENIASITSALNQFSSGLTFEQALARYGEAMIFSGSQKPEGVLSFDNTVTKTINGTVYTVYGFNVWSDFNLSGPKVLDLTPVEMRPHSITIHSTNEWKNRSGNLSITLNRPSDPNVVFYLMMK